MNQIFEYELMDYKPFEEESFLIKVDERNHLDTQIEDVIGTCYFFILSDNDLKEKARLLIYSKDKRSLDYLLDESISNISLYFSDKSSFTHFGSSHSDRWDNKKFHLKGLVREEMPESFELDKTDWFCFTYEMGALQKTSSSDRNGANSLMIVWNRERKLTDLFG